jgi:hypothetical protein
MITIKGNLVLTENTTYNDNLKVEGNIICEGGTFNLEVFGDLKCWNLKCWDLKCWNLKCWNLNCGNLDCGDLNCGNLDCKNLDCWDLNCLNLDYWDLNCGNLKCWNLDCWDLNCLNLNFSAVAFSYKSFKCKSVIGRRTNSKYFCLDREVEITGGNE